MRVLTKVFQDGKNQAIRLPKEYRIDADEVYIEKVGNTLILKPKKETDWDGFFEKLADVDTSGFMDDVEKRGI